MNERRIDAAFWALRIALGGTAMAAGLDKFTNILTNWEKYLSPAVAKRPCRRATSCAWWE